MVRIQPSGEQIRHTDPPDNGAYAPKTSQQHSLLGDHFDERANQVTHLIGTRLEGDMNKQPIARSLFARRDQRDADLEAFLKDLKTVQLKWTDWADVRFFALAPSVPTQERGGTICCFCCYWWS